MTSQEALIERVAHILDGVAFSRPDLFAGRIRQAKKKAADIIPIIQAEAFERAAKVPARIADSMVGETVEVQEWRKAAKCIESAIFALAEKPKGIQVEG